MWSQEEGGLFKKRILNYEYKIISDNKFLFRVRKEITTNYKF